VRFLVPFSHLCFARADEIDVARGSITPESPGIDHCPLRVSDLMPRTRSGRHSLV